MYFNICCILAHILVYLIDVQIVELWHQEQVHLHHCRKQNWECHMKFVKRANWTHHLQSMLFKSKCGHRINVRGCGSELSKKILKLTKHISCCVSKSHLRYPSHLHWNIKNTCHNDCFLINTYWHNNLFCVTVTYILTCGCFHNQAMKDSSPASTWIPIPLPLCFQTTNSSPEALSYINTAFWFYLTKTHKHARTHKQQIYQKTKTMHRR